VFFDSHCHIDFDEFDDDRAEVLLRATELGVNQLVIPGVYPDQWRKAEVAVDYCREHGLIAHQAIGLHPWWIDDQFFDLNTLAMQLKQHTVPSVVAVGECGLDALRETPIDKQIHVLQIHFETANEFDLPVILHCVKAHDVMLDLLRRAKLTKGGVVHGFGGSYEVAQRYCDLGFSIGVGAMATRPHASKAHNAFTRLPLECLMLETDSPSMPIWRDQPDWSKQRNEPANLVAIAGALATLREIDIETIAQQCMLNAQQLFGVIGSVPIS
jgi:TatD DNase family protein